MWAERQIGTAVGSHLMTSRKLQLLEGLIELSFLSGSRVTVQGPAALTLSGQDQFALHAGDVCVLVGPEAKGFTVNTPFARVVDFGTEFGVRVEDDGALEH